MKMTNICSAVAPKGQGHVATITHNSKFIQDLKLVQTILVPKFSLLSATQQIASIEQSKQDNINLALIKKLSLKGPLGECSVIIPKDLDIIIEKENLASLKISFSNLRENTPINTS
jgi:hypothetical protein